MKTLLKLICATTIASLQYHEGFAQNKKKGDSFPTYEQIRGNKKETVDYVVPRGQGAVTLVPRETVPKTLRGAFTYDEDSVTYILNGRKVRNKKKAENEVNRTDIRIDRVSVGEVGKDGKRVIEIDYEPFKEE